MSSPPDQAEDLEPGAVVGEYVVERKIGQGGMGVVYGATHPLIGKRAAIKVVSRRLSADADAVERFVREAQAVNRIGHPNIVDVFSFGTLPDGRSYFVMEWLRGESLAARLARGTIPLGLTLDVLDGVARALEAAHGAGVIHRDLKPDNVYLVDVPDEPPLVKLLDFGLAKLVLDVDDGRDRAGGGDVVGTPIYVSPEQARGAPVDARSDVYSLGVMAYELCVGRPPFDAPDGVDVMARHIASRPPAPRSLNPGLPAPVEELILEMLAKDPSRRPTVAEVRARVSELRASLPAASTPTARRRELNRLGLVVAGSLVAAVAAVVLLVRPWEHRQDEPPIDPRIELVPAPASAPSPSPDAGPER